MPPGWLSSQNSWKRWPKCGKESLMSMLLLQPGPECSEDGWIDGWDVVSLKFNEQELE